MKFKEGIKFRTKVSVATSLLFFSHCLWLIDFGDIADAKNEKFMDFDGLDDDGMNDESDPQLANSQRRGSATMSNHE